MEMPVGVTMKPKNSILCCGQDILGFGVQVILAKAFQDTLDVNLMIFQGIGEDEDIV